MNYETFWVNPTYTDGNDGNISPDWKGPGWYRMGYPAGTMLSEEPVPYWHCNTEKTTWLMGHHPTTAGESIDGKLCLNYASFELLVGILEYECKYDLQIQIKYCSSYFLYHLEDLSFYSTRYCSKSFSKSL